MSCKITIYIAALIVVLTSCTPAETNCTYGVIVKDSESLQPIRNAKLTFQYGGSPPMVGYTDSEGIYSNTQENCSIVTHIRLSITSNDYRPTQTDLTSVPDIYLNGGPSYEEIWLYPYDSVYSEKIPVDPTIHNLELFGYLKDKDPLTRRAIVLELGNRVSQLSESINEIVEQLVDSLEHDENSEVRVAAAKELGKIGSLAKEALPTLKRVQQDDRDEYVRMAVTKAISEIRQALFLGSNTTKKPRTGTCMVC